MVVACGGCSFLLIIINLGFFAIGVIIIIIIIIIGFAQSCDSGLCCFVGSIIPWCG